MCVGKQGLAGSKIKNGRKAENADRDCHGRGADCYNVLGPVSCDGFSSTPILLQGQETHVSWPRSIHIPRGCVLQGRAVCGAPVSGGKRSRVCRSGAPPPRPPSAPAPPALTWHVPRPAVTCSESSGRGFHTIMLPLSQFLSVQGVLASGEPGGGLRSPGRTSLFLC